MNPTTLAGWLAYLEALHPKTIALGLERVAAVKRALGLRLDVPVITVGGTNGKGSTCAMLESILSAAGYRVGAYSSPHLLRYNERVRIARKEASDERLCEAFAAVEAARGDTPLTYFEFGTLAAIWLFGRESVEAAVLEVGLGGRLDAVNAFDPDCAVVTSVAFDHMEYLGNTLDAIGVEKAGIFRPARPAIYGDEQPPASLVAHARDIGAEYLAFGADFGFKREPAQWQYWGRRGRRLSLPFPSLRGDYQLKNASSCLAALDELRDRLPVSAQHVKQGLLEVDLPARFQVLPGRPSVVLDVAHNPQAAAALARNLRAFAGAGKTFAVFGMLRDKDMRGVIDALASVVDEWLVAGIAAARGATGEQLIEQLAAAGLRERASLHVDLSQAYEQVCRRAGQDDRIVIFGSFYTVAEILKTRSRGAAT